MQPQFGELKFAEAGFVTGLGKFVVKWQKVVGGYDIQFETPTGTEGEVVLPSVGADSSISFNGVVDTRWKEDRGALMATLPGGKWGFNIRSKATGKAK